jgi:uncharacterized protein (TIGR00730 family)
VTPTTSRASDEDADRPLRVCVFCGSSDGRSPGYGRAAVATGAAIARRGWSLVYGGAQVGLMGMLADAALEWGGEVVGVIPHGLFRDEVAHVGLTRLHEVDGMLERKALMAELSDVFVALPGGMGTLDELFEMLTWSQLEVHPNPKPNGLLDVDGFWGDLVTFLDRATAEGFIRAQHRALLEVDDDVERLLDRLAAASRRTAT